MNFLNKLIISGKIYKKPVEEISLSGIKYCYFMLEHISKQIEVKYIRKAWCKIKILISGEKFNKYKTKIKIGNKVIVIGFITTHINTYTSNKIVLHANKIKLIHFGD